MQFDVETLTKAMIERTRSEFGASRWSKIGDFAELEFRKLALTIEEVNRLYKDGKINAKRAFELVQAQRNTAETVLTHIKGLGVRTGRDAVAAAARAARVLVNRFIGFKLI